MLGIKSIRLAAVTGTIALIVGASCADQHAVIGSGPSSQASSAPVDDGWDRYLVNPGTASIDYDPASIIVGYRRNAAVPANLAAGTPAVSVAASKPNAILRQDKQYEPLTDAIASRYGLSIGQQVYIRKLHFASFKLPAGASGNAVLQAVRRDFARAIEYAAYDPKIYACWEPNDELYTQSTTTTGPQWILKKSRFNEAWDFTTGAANVRVAVVDTGCLMSHIELIGQVLDPQTEFPSEQLDVVNGDNTMEDDVDHGTFLCGLVAAKTNEVFGMAGAAPDCRVIPVKISNDGSSSHALFVAGCMLGFQLGAKVVNLSWRSTVGSPPLQQMVDDIYNGGGLLFVSCANDGNSDMTWPAAYDNAVAVGNSDANDSREPSSTYGDWVDIAAPGVNLYSTGNHFNDEHHGPWTGTSFSSPLTAAAAALL